MTKNIKILLCMMLVIWMFFIYLLVDQNNMIKGLSIMTTRIHILLSKMGEKLQYRKPYQTFSKWEIICYLIHNLLSNMTYALLANEENETKKVIPTILQHVLQEFQDVIHDEISPSLPPKYKRFNIASILFLVLSFLINLPISSYRMSLKGVRMNNYKVKLMNSCLKIKYKN